MTERRVPSLLLAVIVGLALTGCSSPTASDPPTAPGGPSTSSTLAALQLAGDPAGAAGASWTYRATDNGVAYDLRGVLFKPAGNGPFPAVIVSHGAGGNSTGYSSAIARVMVQWGLVVIATNYTHAGGVPLGAPGSLTQPGASTPNLQRAEKLLDILRALGYVDMRRVAAHGHSMGAFLTAYLISADSASFLVASHTAGGAIPDGFSAAAPTESQVAGIAIPYQMHHGDADLVVPIANDQRLAGVLSRRNVTYQLVVYPGADHDDVSQSSLVLERVRSWYTDYGLFR